MESFSTKPNLEQIKIFLQSFQPGIFQKNLITIKDDHRSTYPE